MTSWIGLQCDAAVVYLKNEETPVFGFIQNQSETQVLMRCLEGGVLKDRIIPMSEVELVLNTVQPQRLAVLNPSKPALYRDYAEELAVKRADYSTFTSRNAFKIARPPGYARKSQ